MRILVTGGCGFVGSSIALGLKKSNPKLDLICFDNLRRRGSELNIKRLKESSILFIHGDIRNKDDLFTILDVNLIIDCSAEPSVLAGTSSPEYVINTNLIGTINCLEYARVNNCNFIFLSTSRVYSIPKLLELPLEVNNNRFSLAEIDQLSGFSKLGINENFSTNGIKSIYGATKISSEILIHEYINAFNINAIINRCGVIAGPWQFGKIDQGVAVLWMANHFWKKNLNYIGFGGDGYQVRDFLHIDDLVKLIIIQIETIKQFSGQVFNVGGGVENSCSLVELTKICENVSKNKIDIGKMDVDRNDDIPYFITDFSKIKNISGWAPEKSLENILVDIYSWIDENKNELINIL